MAVRGRKPSPASQGDSKDRNMAGNEPSDPAETPSMTLEEKIAAIDQEIRTIHHFFVSKGYTPMEIERGAKPLFDGFTKASRKRLVITAVKLAVLLLVGYGLLQSEWAYEVGLKYGRIAMVKAVLPFWDWRGLYYKNCLVDNPYYEYGQLYPEDCEICDELKAIPRESNLSNVDLIEQYMNRDVPVIVTDATEEWPARDLFNISFLEELFVDNPELRDYTGCYFGSNIRTVEGNNKQFLRKVAAGIVKRFYAHWENCMAPVAKGLREFYQKPYFLPPSTEMSKTNWIFVAKDFRGRTFKPIPMEHPFIWYAQIKGESKIKLLARKPCHTNCREIVETIHEGEMFFMTDRLWYFDYLPNGEGETIAIAAGGNFD